MILIKRKKLWLIALIILIIATGGWAGYTIFHALTPIRIGVLLPITGGIDLKEPLEWAKDNINQQGGIGGRPVELVYMDTSTGNITQMAEELLADNSIQIVIGPRNSDDVYKLAPEFIEKNKLLISPMATAGSITLAFENQGYFWRTTQSDVAQAQVITTLMNEKGVHRISVLADNTMYGETFYQWSGFFATEYGLDLVSIQQFEQNSSTLDADVDAALQANPEYIIAACDNPSDAAAIKREIDRSGKPVKLFLTDGAVSPTLISSLGLEAEGLEGTSPTADPSTNFSIEYEEKFGHTPTDFAAPTYDALLLAAYTSARQDATLTESPADSIQHVVSGNGTSLGWDAQAVHENILAILNGQTPRISGASGPLIYDREVGVDPLDTYYSYWVIRNGSFQTVRVFSANATATGISIARSRPSESLMSPVILTMGKNIPLVAKTGFEAVIIAPTNGWINYRHQADGLTLYTLLRDNGVPDDNIILMLYDDIPTLPVNPIPGNVHHLPGGPNIRLGANVVYTGSQVTAATLQNVLTGTKTNSTPVVLDSNASTDVFVYIVGHGIPGTIDFWNDNDIFTTDDFTNVTNTMSREQKYRQLVFMDDTCFGESIAINATAPGLLYLTGSSSVEPSFAAIYDISIQQWLSDQFTAEAVSLIQENPNITFQELYNESYTNVTGSHVQLITTGNVSTLGESVLEFLKP